MAASELLPVRDLHKQNGYPCYSFGYKDKGEKKQRYCEKRRRVEMDDTEEGSQLMDVGVRTDSMRLRSPGNNMSAATQCFITVTPTLQRGCGGSVPPACSDPGLASVHQLFQQTSQRLPGRVMTSQNIYLSHLCPFYNNEHTRTAGAAKSPPNTAEKGLIQLNLQPLCRSTPMTGPAVVIWTRKPSGLGISPKQDYVVKVCYFQSRNKGQPGRAGRGSRENERTLFKMAARQKTNKQERSRTPNPSAACAGSVSRLAALSAKAYNNPHLHSRGSAPWWLK
ncbi:uncharacterized protein LOC114433006 isoform X1 [Parambassis ranga]|uniref:Uncharacterized protein LOC114433006 isoform X1 n=1 Tax=Parambassis ranga TaxID=210632 RepID=A0A6P7I2F2_9TELE|nr:uncharacterized protein LOC114433006 isoform X1 [Parambassis ranga]